MTAICVLDFAKELKSFEDGRLYNVYKLQLTKKLVFKLKLQLAKILHVFKNFVVFIKEMFHRYYMHSDIFRRFKFVARR